MVEGAAGSGAVRAASRPMTLWLVVRYGFEAILVVFFLGLFRLMPLPLASAVGSRLARWIGPYTKAHRIGRMNLSLVLPEQSADHAMIMRQVWDNLGRTVAEFAHLHRDAFWRRVHVDGLERLRSIASDESDAHRAIFISAHLGNWEVTSVTAFRQHIPSILVYRSANNPLVDRVIRWQRSRLSQSLVAKGPSGALHVVRALKRGHAVGMLVDQKMNDGVAIPFLGYPAMTAPAVAELARRYHVPVIPCRVERLPGVRFRLTIHSPLYVAEGDNATQDIHDFLTKMNHMLAQWIVDDPGQWFWVHQRWGKPGEVEALRSTEQETQVNG